MVKKNAVVIASVVIAGAIVATYVLSGNMNMGLRDLEIPYNRLLLHPSLTIQQ
jgi:hypothetical protein